MRRMYSEQELTRIIGEVFDQKLESGALDSSISDAVDAYLVEHPVDITALEGQTIAPAIINATGSITAPSIIETMSGYSFVGSTDAKVTFDYIYCGVVKNGNKLTFVECFTFTLDSDQSAASINAGHFVIPTAVFNKLYPVQFAGSIDLLNYDNISVVKRSDLTDVSTKQYATKSGSQNVNMIFNTAGMDKETEYYMRIELTFLLSDNLAS